MLTTEGAQVMLRPRTAVGRFFTFGLPIPVARDTMAARRALLAALTVTLTCLLVLIDNGQTLRDSLPVQVLSIASGACLLGVCVMPIA